MTYPEYMFIDGDTLGFTVDSAFTICPPDTGDTNCHNNGVYISDWYGHRVVKIDDMTGVGWISYGSHGTGIGHFDGPKDVEVGLDGRIYIADRGNNRIVRIDDMTGAGWVSTPVWLGLNWPRQISLDSSGRILIADDHNHRVLRIDDISGAGYVTWGEGILFYPNAIFEGPDGKIYITDTGNHRFVRIDDFSSTDYETFGSHGSGVNQFDGPRNFFFDSDNRIIVTDDYDNRVVRFEDFTGAGWTRLEHEYFGDGICLDCEERIYISGNDWIIRFDDMSGAGWTTFGSSGTGIGEFEHTIGICVHMIWE